MEASCFLSFFTSCKKLLVLEVEESLLAEELCNVLAQLFLDAEQLIVLRNAVGTGRSAGLDLACIQSNSDVSDGSVLGLAGAVRYDGGVACAVRSRPESQSESRSG